MQKTILVTGGAGYIGSHAVKLLVEHNYRIVVFDNLSNGYRQAITQLEGIGEIKFIKGDLRHPAEIDHLFATEKIDAVMHFAALCSVDESMKHPEQYFENNTIGTYNLLEAMRKSAVDYLIFSSTCAVYGETAYLPVDEKHPQNPVNPYGESKFLSEKIIKWYGALHGLRYVILRYFNVCGASRDGLIGDSKKPSLLLMQNAVRGAMDIEPFYLTCPPVDTPDGTPVRDYIDVEDLVEAHYHALMYLQKGGGSDVFNLGNGKGYSVKEIIKKVEDVFGITMPMPAGKPREGEYAQIYASPHKARQAFDWQTAKSLKESITSLQKWYTHHPNGYDE
jgi:UDP-glucose 4-epimerase